MASDDVVAGGSNAPGHMEDVPEEHPAEDLAAAIVFILIGVGAFVIAQDYRTGTLHRMGPGIFPLIVSGLLTAIGVGLAATTLISGRLREVPRIVPNFETVRAVFFVMMSLLAFAMLVRPAGLFIATAVLAFISTRAEPGRGVLGSLFLSFVLACICALIFVYGIGLPIPLWP